MQYDLSASALAEELGNRLKQARLNRDMAQAELARIVGVTRKTIVQAEKGKAQLDTFIAILVALDLAGQLDSFLPRQGPSPLQLAKLQGRKRERASGQRKAGRGRNSGSIPGGEPSSW